MTLLKLPEEVESGNIEYKWKLIDPSPFKVEKLASQLNWRLYEGDGKAFYYIGVKDDGTIEGLERVELDKSIEVMGKAAAIIKVEFTISTFKISKERFYSSIDFFRRKF